MEKMPLQELPSLEERKHLRRDLMGLTIAEAAKEIGVTARTIQRWEHGTNKLQPDNHRKYQAALQRWRDMVEAAHH